MGFRSSRPGQTGLPGVPNGIGCQQRDRGMSVKRAVVKTATTAPSPPDRGLKAKDLHCGCSGGEAFDPTGFAGQFGLGLTDQGTGVCC